MPSSHPTNFKLVSCYFLIFLVSLVQCMQTRSSGHDNLLPADSEIERTLRRRRLAASFHHHTARMADNANDPPPRKTIKDYMKASISSSSPIERGDLTGNFELRTSLINLIQQDQFHGLPSENPNNHLDNFLQKCATSPTTNVPQNAQRMRLFPFSLADKASYWLKHHPAGHFKTWEQLAQEFVDKFFPPGKTGKLRTAILGFRQHPQESLYEAWERFKDLQHQCPHRGLTDYDVVNAFYSGLKLDTRMNLDASAGGGITEKYPEEVTDLIERMASNSQMWGDVRTGGGLSEVKEASIYESRLEAMAAQMARIEEKINASRAVDTCNMVMSGGLSHDPIDTSQEEANYFGAQGSYNNQGAQTHPGLQWSNPAGAVQMPNQAQNQQQSQQPRAQQPPRQQQGGARLPYIPPHILQRQQQGQPQRTQSEIQLDAFMNAQVLTNQRHETSIAALTAAVQQINVTLNKLAAGAGTLPAQPEPNPRPNANVNAVVAVTTRRGTTTSPPMVLVSQWPPRENTVPKAVEEKTPMEGEPNEAEPSPVTTVPPVVEKVVEAPPVEPVEKTKPAPNVPFPQRLVKADIERRKGKFVELLKNIQLNIPFLDAVTEIPTYARYLKELITGNRRVKKVLLAQECTEAITDVQATKRGDPGSFTVPCSIAGVPIDRALIDLGASISLMPLTIYTKLKTDTDMEPTDMTIQLADSSITYPLGIARDVIVQLGGGIQVPTDFVIMDMPGKSSNQLILGRPFMNTAGVLIDVRNGTLSMHVGDMEVSYHLPSKMKTRSPVFAEASYVSLLEDDDLIESYVEDQWYEAQHYGKEDGDDDPGFDRAMEAFFIELNKQPPPDIKQAEFHKKHHDEDPLARRIREHVKRADRRHKETLKIDGSLVEASSSLHA